MAEPTAVVYVRRRDAKAAKSGLERASLLDRRFRMAPAVNGDVCGASVPCTDPSIIDDGVAGEGAAAALDLRDCIAVPVLPESVEMLRQHVRGKGNCNSATSASCDESEPSKTPEAGDCGSRDSDELSWMRSLEVVGFGRQVCPFSTSVLGNTSKRVRAAAGGTKGNGANGRIPFSNVQYTLVDTLTAWLKNSSASTSHEQNNNARTIEAMVRELSVRTCPKKLEVMGDDRTLVVPRQALFVSPRQSFRGKEEEAQLSKEVGIGRKGDDAEFRELLSTVIRRGRTRSENESIDAAVMEEIQSLLWENLARDHNSPRVVRRGDIDPESGERESGHRILWPMPPPDSTTDGDCNRGFLPSRTGPNSPGWITVTEHGIRQSFDLSRVMFSRGNVTEKKRFGALVRPGERVLDMYAGIGYYTLPALVHGKAGHVTACEWNPHALEALRYNLRANGVEDGATMLEGDCRVSLQGHIEQSRDASDESNQFDRISLGLLPSSEGGWAAAVACLRRGTGGWLHVHGNVPTAERTNWAHWLVRSLADIAHEAQANEWIAVCAHVEKVKSFAPKVDHVVADVFVGPRDSPKLSSVTVVNSTGVMETSGFALTPLNVPPPSCALSEGGILHQGWLREGGGCTAHKNESKKHFELVNAGETNESPMQTIADLPKEVLVETLSYLSRKELGACHSVCRSVHAACLDPLLWRGLAVRAYGKDIVNTTAEFYRSFKEMIMDDNCMGAMPTIDNGVIACHYLNNRIPDYFFVVLIASVKYYRPCNQIRIYIDARGETDLRNPGDSTMERRNLDSDGRSAPERGSTPCDPIQGRFVSELSGRVHGHYKGFVAYNADAFMRQGRYYFTFADIRVNRMLPLMGGGFSDYPSVPLLEVRENNGLLEAFARNGKVVYAGMASPFARDTDEVERRRFEGHVDENVLQRHIHPGRAAGMWWRRRKWWV
ncbi:hypothetical protein ACHAXT_007248 [Thalassiosira profunda]